MPRKPNQQSLEIVTAENGFMVYVGRGQHDMSSPFVFENMRGLLEFIADYHNEKVSIYEA